MFVDAAKIVAAKLGTYHIFFGHKSERLDTSTTFLFTPLLPCLLFFHACTHKPLRFAVLLRFTMGSIDMQSMMSSLFPDDTSRLLGTIIASLLFVRAVLTWFIKKDDSKQTSKSKVDNTSDVATETSPWEDENEDDTPIDGKLRNVFSVKQKPINTGKGSSSKQASTDRPFESSYYFAHNKHSTG